MRTLKVAILALVLAGLAATAQAGTDMAALAPADAQAILVTVDAAGLRQMLMESKFWGNIVHYDTITGEHVIPCRFCGGC